MREALATAWASKVPAFLVLLLVATMCAATIATVGRTAAAEQQLLARLDSAGSRVLVVGDARGQGLLSPTVIDQATGLSTAEPAAGTLIPIDVVNGVIGQGGTRVPAWGVHGDLSVVATLTAGRWPGPGEAIVTRAAMDRLGMDHPVGWVAQASTTVVDDWSVVGSFTPREPFGDYDTGVLHVAPEGRDQDALYVVLTTAQAAQVTQTQVLRLIDPPAPDALTITSPVSLAQLQGQVTGDLALFGRTSVDAARSAGPAPPSSPSSSCAPRPQPWSAQPSAPPQASCSPGGSTPYRPGTSSPARRRSPSSPPSRRPSCPRCSRPPATPSGSCGHREGTKEGC